jgi:hypothetical protein
MFTRSHALAAVLTANAAARRCTGTACGEALLQCGAGVLGVDACAHYCVPPEDLRLLEGFAVTEGGEVTTVFAREDLRAVALARHGAAGLAAAQSAARRRRMRAGSKRLREGDGEDGEDAGSGDDGVTPWEPLPLYCKDCVGAAAAAAAAAAAVEEETSAALGAAEETDERGASTTAAEAEEAAAATATMAAANSAAQAAATPSPAATPRAPAKRPRLSTAARAADGKRYIVQRHQHGSEPVAVGKAGGPAGAGNAAAAQRRARAKPR